MRFSACDARLSENIVKLDLYLIFCHVQRPRRRPIVIFFCFIFKTWCWEECGQCGNCSENIRHMFRRSPWSCCHWNKSFKKVSMRLFAYDTRLAANLEKHDLRLVYCHVENASWRPLSKTFWLLHRDRMLKVMRSLRRLQCHIINTRSESPGNFCSRKGVHKDFCTCQYTCR